MLRNFPGVLRANLKLQLARQSYQLGLRTLKAFLQLAESDIDNLRLYYAEVLKEKLAFEDDDPQLLKTADDLIMSMARRVGFALIKRVSYPVGLRELEETYQDVLRVDGPSTSISMVDLAIKLDNFNEFPKQEMQDARRH